MLYFSADAHLGHTNIIKYCNRPFANADEMNRTIIDNINAIIQPDDTYWHLGDLAWKIDDLKWFISQVNCNHINWLLGNHDVHVTKKNLDDIPKITIYKGYVDLRIEKQAVTLCHFPMRSWQAKSHGAWHLYGHVHGRILDPDPFSLDVGVDTNNFKPWSWEQIKEYMTKYKIE